MERGHVFFLSLGGILLLLHSFSVAVPAPHSLLSFQAIKQRHAISCRLLFAHTSRRLAPHGPLFLTARRAHLVSIRLLLRDGLAL